MLKTTLPLQQRIAAALTRTTTFYHSHSFRPFTPKDEDDLVHVIKTKPQHVLKHVRQQVWHSRKRELQFRHTVTHLMIILQDFLRKQVVDPVSASRIMEGVLAECVTYSQHDMAHLLFRAFLRFRKYGCTITVDAIRFLFESYKSNDSTELMRQLANEMKSDVALRPLCIAAYLFANEPAEAEALREGLSLQELTTEDILALVDGYGKLGEREALFDMLEHLSGRPPAAQARIYGALLRIFYKRDDDAAFTQVLQSAMEAKTPLDEPIFIVILRQKMRRVTSIADIAAVEEEMKGMGYVAGATGNAIVITAYARLIHYDNRGSEEVMLSKVDALLSFIELRLKEGDPDAEISAAHIRAVIRGYGAARRADAMRNAWLRMQYKGLTNEVTIYNEMFRWLALMRNVKDVLRLKEDMAQDGVKPDSLTYTWMLRALGKFYPRHVEKLFAEIEERRVRLDIHLCNTLIGIFGDLRMYDRVESLVSEMKQREEAGTLQLSPITFAILLRVFSHDIPTAEALYADARKRHLAEHPHVQTCMLHVYALAATAPRGDSTKCDEFLEEIAVWGTDVYNVLLNMYSRLGSRAKFEETLAKMQRAQVAMDEVTVGTLVTAYSRWGAREEVAKVIELFKKNEGEVTATFYSVLASCQNRLGDADGVTSAWDDLVASKLFPDTEVYNQFLTLYSRQHNFPKMQGVLDYMMKHVPPNPVTATTVLDVLGKSGRVAEMATLFEDMKATADTQPTSVTFHQVMNAYAKSGDVAQMDKVHAEYRERGFANDAVTYNILMDGYGRARDFERLREVLRQRLSDGIPLDDFAYCIMIAAYSKARLEKDVVRLFTEATGAHDVSLLSRRIAWSCVDAFCRCGNVEYMEKAIRLLQSTDPTEQQRASDIGRLIPYYCRLGLMEKVEGLEKDLAEHRGEALSYSTLNAIARGYARLGRFEKTIETLHRIRDRNWVPDASTALQLSGAFLKAGHHEQAEQIVEWRRRYAKAVGTASAAGVSGDAASSV